MSRKGEKNIVASVLANLRSQSKSNGPRLALTKKQRILTCCPLDGLLFHFRARTP
jgi:hypothetical protein